jgi:hypothetical protein
MVRLGMAQRRKTGGRSSSGSRGSRGHATRGTAPSAPDISKLHLMEPSEAAKQHQPSAVDAMGQDKRRQVVGHSYGPSRRSQIMFFVAVGAVLVVVVGGWITLVGIFDKPPTHFSDKAPWSKTATGAQLASEQSATPAPPSSPCGEPGSEYPIPPNSPCAPPNKANAFQGTSAGK